MNRYYNSKNGEKRQYGTFTFSDANMTQTEAVPVPCDMD